MLQSQINYWNLEETKRHNLATEEASFQQARASEISANASRLQAEVAEKTLPFKAMEAQATMQQAQAALENAATNRGNLDVNRMNAATNSRNADVNQQNADTNARNAATNEWNAAINEWNAATNARNADTNAYNADINAWNAQTNAIVGHSTAYKNYAEGTLTYAKVPEQQEKNYQAAVTSHYTNAEHVVGLIDTGSHVVNNLGSGLGSLMRGAGGLLGAVTDVLTKPKTTSSNSTSHSSLGQTVHNTISQGFKDLSGISALDSLADTLVDQNKLVLKKFGLNILGGIK